jgi:hypothetical protein
MYIQPQYMNLQSLVEPLIKMVYIEQVRRLRFFHYITPILRFVMSQQIVLQTSFVGVVVGGRTRQLQKTFRQLTLMVRDHIISFRTLMSVCIKVRQMHFLQQLIMVPAP